MSDQVSTVQKPTWAERKILRDTRVMLRISAEALARANAEIGFLPGDPRHIQFQIKLRNQLARAAGYRKFNSSLTSSATKPSSNIDPLAMVA